MYKILSKNILYFFFYFQTNNIHNLSLKKQDSCETSSYTSKVFLSLLLCLLFCFCLCLDIFNLPWFLIKLFKSPPSSTCSDKQIHPISPALKLLLCLAWNWALANKPHGWLVSPNKKRWQEEVYGVTKDHMTSLDHIGFIQQLFALLKHHPLPTAWSHFSSLHI